MLIMQVVLQLIKRSSLAYIKNNESVCSIVLLWRIMFRNRAVRGIFLNGRHGVLLCVLGASDRLITGLLLFIRLFKPQTFLNKFDVHENDNARDVVDHVLALLPRFRRLPDNCVGCLLGVASGIEG